MGLEEANWKEQTCRRKCTDEEADQDSETRVKIFSSPTVLRLHLPSADGRVGISHRACAHPPKCTQRHTQPSHLPHWGFKRQSQFGTSFIEANSVNKQHRTPVCSAQLLRSLRPGVLKRARGLGLPASVCPPQPPLPPLPQSLPTPSLQTPQATLPEIGAKELLGKFKAKQPAGSSKSISNKGLRGGRKKKAPASRGLALLLL